MENFTIDQVCELLIKKGFDERVVRVFKENEIDGEALLGLSNEHMKDMGLTVVGHRAKLQRLVSQYKSDAAAAVNGGSSGSTASAALHERSAAENEHGRSKQSTASHGGTRPTASSAEDATGYQVRVTCKTSYNVIQPEVDTNQSTALCCMFNSYILPKMHKATSVHICCKQISCFMLESNSLNKLILKLFQVYTEQFAV